MGLAHAGLIVINSCHLHAFLYVIQRQRLKNLLLCICSSFESCKALSANYFYGDLFITLRYAV